MFFCSETGTGATKAVAVPEKPTPNAQIGNCNDKLRDVVK